MAFFFVSFLPDWKGLLHLYEATGKHQYLVGAVFGARQLIHGQQPEPIAGDKESPPCDYWIQKFD